MASAQSVLAPEQHPEATCLRLDKYLWFSRLLKSRSDAVRLCESRHLRLDGRVIDKAHAMVRIGSVISFPRHGRVMIIRVVAIPKRRGPASEAARTFQDLSSGRKAAISLLEPAGEAAAVM